MMQRPFIAWGKTIKTKKQRNENSKTTHGIACPEILQHNNAARL
jgi:hypothetical protein